MSARSSQRVSRRRIGGRTAAVRPMAAAASGYAIQSYSPANRKSVRPRKTRRATRPEGSDRGFSVVVLVLMPVVARIVVLVAREVDLVQDDGGRLRRRRHDGLEGALRKTPARHLGPDHERHA